MKDFEKTWNNLLHFVEKGDKIKMVVKLNDLCDLKGMKKMELLDISISGFKNIKEFKMEFGSINVLVGQNGYGKSNIIDAIDFAFDFIHSPSNKRIHMMS